VSRGLLTSALLPFWQSLNLRPWLCARLRRAHFLAPAARLRQLLEPPQHRRVLVAASFDVKSSARLAGHFDGDPQMLGREALLHAVGPFHEADAVARKILLTANIEELGNSLEPATITLV